MKQPTAALFSDPDLVNVETATLLPTLFSVTDYVASFQQHEESNILMLLFQHVKFVTEQYTQGSLDTPLDGSKDFGLWSLNWHCWILKQATVFDSDVPQSHLKNSISTSTDVNYNTEPRYYPENMGQNNGFAIRVTCTYS